MNESALILSVFKYRLRAGLVSHTKQTNTATEQNKHQMVWESVESVQYERKRSMEEGIYERLNE